MFFMIHACMSVACVSACVCTYMCACLFTVHVCMCMCIYDYMCAWKNVCMRVLACVQEFILTVICYSQPPTFCHGLLDLSVHESIRTTTLFNPPTTFL